MEKTEEIRCPECGAYIHLEWKIQDKKEKEEEFKEIKETLKDA